MALLGGLLSVVSPATANLLSYAMLLLVAIFLLGFAGMTWFFWRQYKKTKVSAATQA